MPLRADVDPFTHNLALSHENMASFKFHVNSTLPPNSLSFPSFDGIPHGASGVIFQIAMGQWTWFVALQVYPCSVIGLTQCKIPIYTDAVKVDNEIQ